MKLELILEPRETRMDGRAGNDPYPAQSKSAPVVIPVMNESKCNELT